MGVEDKLQLSLGTALTPQTLTYSALLFRIMQCNKMGYCFSAVLWVNTLAFSLQSILGSVSLSVSLPPAYRLLLRQG